MEKVMETIKKNKKSYLFSILFFNIFSGCFMFPLTIEPVYFFLITIVSYGTIGIIYTCIIEKRLLYVYLIIAASNLIGMVLRYILEYGEYSNEVNFTETNIIIAIIVIPFCITIVSYLIKRIFIEKSASMK